MKKTYKKIFYIALSVIFLILVILAVIPTRLSFADIKGHLIVSEENDYLYVGIDFYASEIDQMASKNGHVYLYSLEDGSRCYAQYLYCKASFFDQRNNKYIIIPYPITVPSMALPLMLEATELK